MASLQRTAVMGSRLQARMAARYQHALNTFHDSVYEFNKQLDEEQMQQLVSLKDFLQKSHSECEETLRVEARRVESHESHLAQATSSSVAADDVLQPFTDCYHDVEVRIDPSRARLQAERERILSLCVAMGDSHKTRLDAIGRCEENMEMREKERRERLKKALVEFVESLTRISYTSINASHVLAQRAIHDINENLCKNQTGRKVLLAQLRCREILRQRHYSRKLADVYSTSLELMMRSSLQWGVTLLQTAYFRRPLCRMRELEQMSQLVSNIRRDGMQFFENMATMVQSLRRARELLPTECGPICGGTLPDGWLRSFDGGLFSPVFPVSPSEVTVEWRVKANVLVRNAMVHCVTLAEEVKMAEEQLCAEAESILTDLHAVVQWACEPVSKEAKLLAKASLDGVDDVYVRFTAPNPVLCSQFTAEVEASIPPLLATIRRESGWFSSTMTAELNSQHAILEGLLLTGPSNLLLTFDKATVALEKVATNSLGSIRVRFIELYEARKDHEDALHQVETEFAHKQQELQHAPTLEAAEVMFVEGLTILERIAALHTDFHRHVVQSLQRILHDGQVEMEENCAKLLLLLGLESEAACIQREREEAEAAAAAAEAAMKKGRAKEVVVEPDSDSDEDTMPSYPKITAVDGQIYFIVGSIRLEDRPSETSAEMPSPSQPQSKKTKNAGESGRASGTTGNKKKISSQQRQKGGKKMKGGGTGGENSESSRNSNAISPVPTVVIPPSFLRTYDNLVSNAVQENNGRVTFSLASLEEWREMLRVEILNWTVHLRHASLEHVQKQCASKKSEIDAETNEVLRHHRRRPATLQSDAYEGRVREIETTRAKKENNCARLRERVHALEVFWSSIEDDDSMEARSAKLFEQLQEMEKMTHKANSANALMSQERTFVSLVSSSIEAHTKRYNDIMADVTKQKNLLEAEGRNFLLHCGKSLPDDLDEIEDMSPWEDEDNRDCKEVIDILLRLHNAAKAIRDKLTADREQHIRQLDTIKSNYTMAFEQNVGELQVIARLQEILSRLKVQVHSLVTLSETNEGKIEETLNELEEKLSSPPTLHDFYTTLSEIVGREYSASVGAAEVRSSPIAAGGSSYSIPPSSSPTGASPSPSPNMMSPTLARVVGSGAMALTEEHAHEVETEVNERLAEVKIDIQRQIRASDPSKVLRLLDHIREVMYSRGRYLNCLQYGVELFNVPQENYIDPRLGAANDTQTEGMGNTPSTTAGARTSAASATSLTPTSGRGHRKSKVSAAAGASTSILASLYTTSETPDVLPAEQQVNEWFSALKAQAGSLMEHHFAVCPPPLMRRLPGTAGGNFKDVMDMCDRVCEQQQRRVSQHVTRAAKHYREQVQRLFRVLQKIPSYLVNSTYTLSAMALERRVAAVFDVFASFYGESDALRSVHDRLVKVTLASNYNRDKLNALCEAEDARQTVTRATIEKFWGYVLREMEDETAMHAARSLNVNNNFFALLRGVVVPDSLKPTDDNGGCHRGLRGLLHLKAKEERAKEQLQRTGKRDCRLRETMMTRNATTSSQTARRTEPISSAFARDAGPEALPLLPLVEVEQCRLPLRAFRPLEEFNAAHPNAAVILPQKQMSPALARMSLVARTPTLLSGRRRKSEAAATPAADERSHVVSIIAPETPLNAEIAKLTQQSVQRFNKISSNSVKKTIEAFQKWSDQEERWRETWGASMKRLKE